MILQLGVVKDFSFKYVQVLWTSVWNDGDDPALLNWAHASPVRLMDRYGKKTPRIW